MRNNDSSLISVHTSSAITLEDFKYCIVLYYVSRSIRWYVSQYMQRRADTLLDFLAFGMRILGAVQYFILLRLRNLQLSKELFLGLFELFGWGGLWKYLSEFD